MPTQIYENRSEDTNSQVIASPMVGRTLADMGATVFKIVTEKRPRRALFDEETNCGHPVRHSYELSTVPLDMDTVFARQAANSRSSSTSTRPLSRRARFRSVFESGRPHECLWRGHSFVFWNVTWPRESLELSKVQSRA